MGLTQMRVPWPYRVALWSLLISLSLGAWMVWKINAPTVDVRIKEPLVVYGATTIRAGDVIELVLDYCATDEAFGWVGGVFASNGVITPHVGVWPASLPDGCHVVHMRVTTPKTLSPGSYRFYMVRDYRPTLLGRVQRHIQSDAFEVVP